MKRNILISALSLAAILGLTGCSDSPKTVVEKQITATLNNDYSEAIKPLTKEAKRRFVSMNIMACRPVANEYVNNVGMDMGESNEYMNRCLKMANKNFGNPTFKIIKEEEQGYEKLVTVEYTDAKGNKINNVVRLGKVDGEWRIL